MQRKQLLALFVTNLVIFTVARATAMLLPIHLTQLGVDEIMIGLVLSLMFASLAVTTLGSGWLSNHFQRRKHWIIFAGAVSVPITYLMGQTNSVGLFSIFAIIVWGSYGVTLTMANILTGMYADSKQRGRIFGIIGTTVVVGAIISGFIAGAIVDNWGYTALFTFCSLGGIVQIVFGLMLEDKVIKDNTKTVSKQVRASQPIPTSIWFVIIACALTQMAISAVHMTRPLLMDGLGFDASAITGATAIGGMFALPLPLIIGWLSDKLGRNRLLMISCLAVHFGVLLIVPATHLWHFWVSAILLRAISAGQTVGLAWVNDLATPETLATATARFSAGSWIANVIAFSVMGFIIEMLGLRMTLFIAAMFPLISIILVVIVSRRPRPVQQLRVAIST